MKTYKDIILREIERRTSKDVHPKRALMKKHLMPAAKSKQKEIRK